MINERDPRNKAKTGDRAAALAALQSLRPHPPIGSDLLQAFSDQLRAQDGLVERAASLDDVARYVVDNIFKAENRELSVAMGSDPLLADLPLDAYGEFKRVGTESIGHGGVAISVAVAAVAETGSLVLCSGIDNPTLFNFLPDHHVVVARERDIVGSLEDMWALLRKHYPQGLPRAINLITGPSSTADVAVTFVMGVHGPTRLHALIMAG